MKKSYYLYALAAIVIIVLAVVLYQNRPSAQEQAMQACIDAGGTFDAVSASCSPAGTPVTTVTTTTTTAGPNGTKQTSVSTVSPAKPIAPSQPSSASSIGTIFTPPTGTIALPVNYDMASTTDTIRLASPSQGNGTVSPLQVTGLALKQWFSPGGSFSVVLVNAAGRILARGTVAAQGNLQTTSFIPFTGNLTFAYQQGDTSGTFYLINGNPSGTPSAAMTPVIF